MRRNGLPEGQVRAILAAQAAGADLAYIGSAFIATKEANAVQGYKDMIVASGGVGSEAFRARLASGGSIATWSPRTSR